MKGRQLVRKLLSPAPFAAITGAVMLLLLLTMMRMTMFHAADKHLARQHDLDVAQRIADQLRPDQGDLAAHGQHIFSAYFDTRSTLGDRKYVRVITVLDTKAYESEFLCQFLNESGCLSFSSVARRSPIGAGMAHKQHYYKEFVLSCPIGNDTRSAAFVFIQTGDASLRSQVLRVRHNPLSLGGQSPTIQQQIINCVSVTFGKPNELWLIEWLEAQRLLRMDKVELHFYQVKNRNFEAVAQAYSAEGFLNVRRIGCPFCDPSNEWLELLLMSPAINQCFYENLGGYTFTAVFDLDEIIVPQRQNDYPSMLSALEEKTSTSSFAFRNWYHFSELGENSSVDARMNILRHPFRTKDVSPTGYSTKSIHRSCCVVALHNHFSWENVPQPKTRTGHHDVDVRVGLNEHYKACHFGPNDCKLMTRREDRHDGSRLSKLIGSELTAAFQSKIKQILAGADN